MHQRSRLAYMKNRRIAMIPAVSDAPVTPPTPPVPVVLGIVPSTGPTAGGTHVVIAVDSSAGCTRAAVGGIDVTSFAIDDATHVSGDTAAHVAGAVDITVTNGTGTSAPLVGGFTYTSAWTTPNDSILPTLWWLRGDLGVTNSFGSATAWADQSLRAGAGDANRNQAQATPANYPTYVPVDAAFGNAPTLHMAAQYLQSVGAWSSPAAVPITLVFVGSVANAATGTIIGDEASSGLVDNGSQTFFFNGAAGPLLPAEAVTPCVIVLTDDGSGAPDAAKIFVNDLSTPIDTHATTWGSLAKLSVGAPALFGAGSFKVAEIIAFGGDIHAVANATDLTHLKAYLNARPYGIPVT